MARIDGLEQLLARFRAMQSRWIRPRSSVVVGYQTNYAVHVHENMEARHPVGQAKFLEQPARELSNDGTLQGIVTTALRRGATVEQALLLAGLRLQRESQRLVPVATGTLKNSAFTRIES